MPAPHRQKRQSEETILSKLDALGAQMTSISTDVALVQQSQNTTNDHLRDLNGKVIAHENRLNDNALINQKIISSLDALLIRITTLEISKNAQNTKWQDTLAWGARILLGILALLFYKVLVSTNIVTNFLHY